MTNRIETYIQRRNLTLAEALSEIDALRNKVGNRENRRTGLARHIQRNIEETMRMSDEQLRVTSCMGRNHGDSDPAHQKAKEVYHILFRLGWDADKSWTADIYYNFFPFKDESRPTIERQLHNYLENNAYYIPLAWMSQIHLREMKQSLYRYLTSNKGPLGMAQELVEKMRKRHFLELVKIDKRYKDSENLRAKIDEKAYKDCVEAWKKTEEYFDVARL